ncbi:hypothetical protein CAPTEDRAFT_197883 [Capitella teleta]|uniref:Uncharacterized protein n=1 Tax=Capitella teleta TaxID=283909 RepID=R7UE01_CAPTE|nr:hypothetical protein CAPTEDRAFT_197883 [Capitella teleta]|eukprot:ELU01472.1 hypothetical protein CAPTEDRAFT_197883 [Capitella teleta]
MALSPSATSNKRTQYCMVQYKDLRTTENFKRYKTARNKATTALRQAKTAYETTLVHKIKKLPQKIWQFINGPRQTSLIPDLVNDDNSLATTNLDKANALDLQYSKLFTRESNQLPPLPSRTNLTLIETITITEEKCAPNSSLSMHLNPLDPTTSIPSSSKKQPPKLLPFSRISSTSPFKQAPSHPIGRYLAIYKNELKAFCQTANSVSRFPPSSQNGLT